MVRQLLNPAEAFHLITFLLHHQQKSNDDFSCLTRWKLPTETVRSPTTKKAISELSGSMDIVINLLQSWPADTCYGRNRSWQGPVQCCISCWPGGLSVIWYRLEYMYRLLWQFPCRVLSRSSIVSMSRRCTFEHYTFLLFWFRCCPQYWTLCINFYPIKDVVTSIPSISCTFLVIRLLTWVCWCESFHDSSSYLAQSKDEWHWAPTVLDIDQGRFMIGYAFLWQA